MIFIACSAGKSHEGAHFKRAFFKLVPSNLQDISLTFITTLKTY